MSISIILDDGSVYEPTAAQKKPVDIECWYDRHRREWVLYPVDDEGNQLVEAVYAFSKAEAKQIKEELINEYAIESVGGKKMKHSKRFQYYQPNKKDLKDEVGDCQIRALSKALNLTWLETFDLVTPICRHLQIMDVFDTNLDNTVAALNELGFNYMGISNKKGSKRPTVDGFAKEHPEGKYIVKVAHHVVAVVDGSYYDTWDSGSCSMYGYFTKMG